MGTKGDACRHKGDQYPRCKGVDSRYARGSVPRMQGDNFATELGGIMKVAM